MKMGWTDILSASLWFLDSGIWWDPGVSIYSQPHEDRHDTHHCKITNSLGARSPPRN
jgi:hypothetical protein